MSTLLIAVASFFGFIIAYHTYGRWLARKIFGLDANAEVPSQQLRDNVDFIPTSKEVIFGHHFTSIAGTGPIVGPAIAVFWGWLPALLWVVLGSIFVGAVHDFGALIVSMRNRGQTVGEIAGRLINPRAKVLFLLILFFSLTIVLAIFGLVIAIIFKIYPASVLSVWVEIPLAVAIGFWVHKKGGKLLIPSILALGAMYVAIFVGAYYLPISLPEAWGNATLIWTGILFVYCFIASVLPVWTLLQPRDYINSHELMVALGLLCLGLVVACFTSNHSSIIENAPAISDEVPADAPPIFPFLFITIACGAISGFHCLVSSGTSSKQVANEKDAQYVGYGAMLLEGALAVVVILACCAGVGMGKVDAVVNEAGQPTGDYQHAEVAAAEGTAAVAVTGREAWKAYYPQQRTTAAGLVIHGWGSHTLKDKVAAFVDGGANFMTSIGIPLRLGVAIIAVLVASFAATTLDTATRLQRYVVQELAETCHLKPLKNKYAATGFALTTAGLVALMPGAGGVLGTGGLILWPLFGATNQLLAGLALMVTVFYLWRRNKPIFFAALPMLAMLLLPAMAMLWQMFNFGNAADGVAGGWLAQMLDPESVPTDSSWLAVHWKNLTLFCFGCFVMGLQLWMIVEGVLTWKKAHGVLEEKLPPLPAKLAAEGGRSC